MKGQIDFEYLNKFHKSFKKIMPGKGVEIEIEKLGAKNGNWIIPAEFKLLFQDFGVRIDPVEIINRDLNDGKHTFMMYNVGGDTGITFIQSA